MGLIVMDRLPIDFDVNSDGMLKRSTTRQVYIRVHEFTNKNVMRYLYIRVSKLVKSDTKITEKER